MSTGRTNTVGATAHHPRRRAGWDDRRQGWRTIQVIRPSDTSAACTPAAVTKDEMLSFLAHPGAMSATNRRTPIGYS